MTSYEITWPDSVLPPLSCYHADNSKRSGFCLHLSVVDYFHTSWNESLKFPKCVSNLLKKINIYLFYVFVVMLDFIIGIS